MPRQRQPKSLREASLTSIVSNFDNFWPAGQLMDLTSIWSPFQYLTDDMIQEMIDMLDKRKLLNEYHFHLLLHANIRRINLSVCTSLHSKNNVIKALRTRCQSAAEDSQTREDSVLFSPGVRQKLTHLEISLYINDRNQEEVSCELLCALFANLPQLTSLKLNDTILNGKVLKVISDSCPNLLDLNFNVYSLRDTDLLYICNSPTHPKNLPKLRHLQLGSVYPSVDILVHLLNCHPGLLYISAPIDHAFEQLYGEEFQSLKKVPPEWIHNLLYMEISGGKFKLSEIDRLNLTFQCCPFLTQPILADLEDPESIKNVSQLKHLKQLSVFVNLSQNEKFSKHMKTTREKTAESHF